MQNAVSGLIGLIASRLATLSRFAKAVVPSVSGLVGSLVNMAFAGSFNTTSIVVLGVGVASALVVYFVPNKAKAAPAPVPVTPTKSGK